MPDIAFVSSPFQGGQAVSVFWDRPHAASYQGQPQMHDRAASDYAEAKSQLGNDRTILSVHQWFCQCTCAQQPMCCLQGTHMGPSPGAERRLMC